MKQIHEKGPYERFFKRPLDFILSLCAIIILSPLFLFLTIFGAIFMRGNPFFIQKRPGKNEKIFKLIKFRTMDNRKNKQGEFLPDNVRLNKYGRILRKTSLDELPELLNILKGDMSIVGPRPQLVQDMVFMTPKQRIRHSVRPGLTGLAQVNGRNNITWEKKFEFDLIYIEKITLFRDINIFLKTIYKVFKCVDTVREGTNSDIDYGDWLLYEGAITNEDYIEKQYEAKRLLVGE